MGPDAPEIRYRHQPFTENHSIRVLRLNPSPDPRADLHCRLDVVSLDEKPKYWALSYSWDAQVPSHAISCSSVAATGTLFITANFAAALRQLRDTTEERTLWIDSICIDRSSLDERSSQVALMGEIYRDAERVIVRLGEKDSATEQAIKLMADIGDVDKVKPPDRGPRDVDYELKRQLQERLHSRARQLTADAQSEETDKIGLLFRHSWFSRMWTIQEVTLPHAIKVDVY